MEKLKTLRENAGLSQKELAEKARVSQPLISALELGTRKTCGYPIFFRLVHALDCPIEDLLDETEAAL